MRISARTPLPPACPTAPHSLEHSLPAAGHTVVEVARRYRVSTDKVRAWIDRRELAAINTATNLCGKPRWVILPEALAEFDQRRAGGLPLKPARRKRRAAGFIDYYADCQDARPASAEKGGQP